MKLIKAVLVFVISFGLLVSSASARPAWLDRRPAETQRQDVLKKSTETLAKLYAAEPLAKEAVEKAYGYATFNDFSTKIVFLGSASGRGVAVNNKTRQRTFMNMYDGSEDGREAGRIFYVLYPIKPNSGDVSLYRKDDIYQRKITLTPDLVR